jgi:hypothetical protein
VSDGTNGISDIFIVPFALNWTFGDLQVNPQFFMVAPTGHKTGTEFTMFGGFAVSTQDPATHYRSGDVVHLEATLEKYLPLSKQTLIGVGPNAFYYQQVTADSGSGAILGGLEGTDIGVCPVVTLIHKAEKYNLSFQAKWLPEIDTKNRLRAIGCGSWPACSSNPSL